MTLPVLKLLGILQYEVAGPAGGLGYIRARAGSRCARISGTYT